MTDLALKSLAAKGLTSLAFLFAGIQFNNISTFAHADGTNALRDLLGIDQVAYDELNSVVTTATAMFIMMPGLSNPRFWSDLNTGQNTIDAAIATGNQDLRNAFGNSGIEGARGTQYSPVNPGPLPENIANSFNGATYTERVLTEDTIMYRVSGGSAREVGSFMSMTPQSGGLQSQLDLALNPAWGNTTENVTQVVVPR